MSDTARDYQTIQPAALEGLEEIFEVRELDASQDASMVRLDANMLSVEEAAARLGISVRAVQKRLKKGTLSGRKEKTTHGERWLVEVRELDASRDASMVRLDANHDELDASQDGRDPNPLIRELQSKLEAASYRIGYLEAQLEAERQQVKLLTDSQHKSGRWQRFRSWFFGQ